MNGSFGVGTPDDPWQLQTPPKTSAFTMHRDVRDGRDTLTRPVLIRSWASDIVGVFEPDYVGIPPRRSGSNPASASGIWRNCSAERRRPDSAQPPDGHAGTDRTGDR